MLKKLFVIILLILPMGCAIAQINKENRATEVRINQKKLELQNLSEHNEVLMKEKEKLISELDEKETTFGNLYGILDKLEKCNARISVATDEQKKKKQNFEQEVGKYKKKISKLRDDHQLSQIDKEERLRSLKNEVKKYLRLGLN